MKALTIWNPYAELMARREKIFETRTWSTDYRGDIAVHAAKKWDTQLKRVLADLHRSFPDHDIPHENELSFGCIIAVGKLQTIYPVEAVHIFHPLEYAVGDYSPGRFAWRIKDIRKLTVPIPVPGRQKLWNWDETQFPEWDKE